MEQKCIDEILEDISGYTEESLEEVQQKYKAGQIEISECRKTLGHNSRLYTVVLKHRADETLFLKEIVNSPGTFGGTLIPGSKTQNPFAKELMWLTLFSKFHGFVPKIKYSNPNTSRLYLEYYNNASFDENIYNSLKSVEEIAAKYGTTPDFVKKIQVLNKSTLDYSGDGIIRCIDISLIHSEIAEIVLEGENPLFDYRDYDGHLEELVTRLGEEEIKLRIEEFFGTMFGFCAEKQQYQQKREALEREIADLKEQHQQKIHILEGEIADLHSRLGDSSHQTFSIFPRNNKLQEEIYSQLSAKGKEVYVQEQDLSSRLSVKVQEALNLAGITSHHDDIVALVGELVQAMSDVNRRKRIDYKYKGKDRRFFIKQRYVSHDNHPGNYLTKYPSLKIEIKMPLEFDLTTLPRSPAGSYKADTILDILDELDALKKKGAPFEGEELQAYQQLCRQYVGLAETDFHKFGLATMPFAMAVFLSHPSLFAIPYERKLGYVNHAIAQELRMHLEEDIILGRPEFSDIREEWISSFRTASVYITMKNMAYLYNLIQKENGGSYGSNGTLIDEKRFNEDKRLLFKNNVDYLFEITANDKDNDNVFGRLYRALKNMPITLPA